MKFNIKKKDQNKSGIYKITNNINNQVYIGRTSDFLRRYKQHSRALKNGECNSKFYSFQKVHPDVAFFFSVVEVTDDIINKEKEYIKKYNSAENGFNVITKDDDFGNMCDWFINNPHHHKHKKVKIPKEKAKKHTKEDYYKQLADWAYDIVSRELRGYM